MRALDEMFPRLVLARIRRCSGGGIMHGRCRGGVESNACDFNQLSKHQSSNMELCSDQRLALPVLFAQSSRQNAQTLH